MTSSHTLLPVTCATTRRQAGRVTSALTLLRRIVGQAPRPMRALAPRLGTTRVLCTGVRQNAQQTVTPTASALLPTTSASQTLTATATLERQLGASLFLLPAPTTSGRRAQSQSVGIRGFALILRSMTGQPGLLLGLASSPTFPTRYDRQPIPFRLF